MTEQQIHLNGVGEINQERTRQIEELGYTIDVDYSQNKCNELAQAAVSYITESTFMWPANWCSAPEYKDRIRTLAKAGACIAAEIDRLKHLQALATNLDNADDGWL